jgi:hypothetical protein
MTFSVDIQGPTVGAGVPDSFFGAPIFGTDILTPFPPGPPGPNPPAAGPLPPPGIFIANPPRFPALQTPGLAIGSHPFPAVKPGWGELDALSYGRDPLDEPAGTCNNGKECFHVFSVDEFAIGLPGSAVRAEGALGNQQAAADIFVKKKMELPTPPILDGNDPFTDGDGISPSGAPGVGLIEPNTPTFSFGFNDGDNLDAVDFDTRLSDRSGPVYFSLDSAFFDDLELGAGPVVPILPLPNYGTAVANGFVGGDVLVGTPTAPPVGGPISVYAPAPLLGLDIFGPDSDDLDALKLAENSDALYQPSIVPFDWLTGDTDMLLFSVRRGSAIIGLLDSIFGIPIEEGDILTTPCPAGSVIPGSGIVCAGGALPGIFTAAEALGLATVRSGTAAQYFDLSGAGLINPAYGMNAWADDLDAYDQKVPEPGTLALLISGFGGLASAGIRRRRKAR